MGVGGRAPVRSGVRLEFPEELPISARRSEIATALGEHAVIVVCGDTGSGKTTQLPKICLEAGRGTRGMIGHTQPRRIAARAVAERLASELGVELGGAVGYQVRFTDCTQPGTRVKVMTDGILLNEIRTSRRLEAYDTLIIDEAHERSLNVDFLLGYLKLVLAERSDLKVIVTSATIDPERFARHFDAAPIIEIRGRAYPIEIRYAPRAQGEDLADAVVAACHAAAAVDVEALGGGTHRDVLVFLPGERWIRDTQQALQKGGPAGFEVLPLYARLQARQQDRVFKPGQAPRIVLATNVAETSLTVPRIRFVIDSGLARVARYAARHRVQGLSVEPIAQANAIQRAGRCGRVAPGMCIRLYAEEDFAQRAAFTDPEILRTNLAGVILRLEALRLGHIDAFPFLDAPPVKAVNDAYRLLHVLGAMDTEHELTRDGALMGRLPLDPRLARLLLTGRAMGCLAEALVLAAALSIIDPREYPADALEAARAQHLKFADGRSDFTTYLNLWSAYRAQRRNGERAFRAWCRDHFLSAARLKEWDDVHAQLTDLVSVFGWRASARRNADHRTVHKAVLAAFVDLVAEKAEQGMYRGMHDSRSFLFQGSPVAAKKPQWIVAAESIATERAYLRTIAQVNPRWVIDVAPHLIKRDYRDPQWSVEQGRVTAREVISLFGLTVSADQRVDYGRIDPAGARAIFIRDALVADALGAELGFLEATRAAKQAVLDWEARLRSRDLYIGDRGIEAFYRERLPDGLRDRNGLVAWCRVPEHAASLVLGPNDLATRAVEGLDAHRYPEALEIAGQSFALRYRYEPGDERDGITLRLPSLFLDAVRPEQLDWTIPGWLRDKVLALLRALPKELRRSLVPLPDTVAALQPSLERRCGRTALDVALSEALEETRGIRIDRAVFARATLPPHFRIYVEVVDERGAVLAGGHDLRALQRELGARPVLARQKPEGREHAWQRRGLVRWDCGLLPDRVAIEEFGGPLELYPALVEGRAGVDLTLLPPGPAAVERHRRGVRRLLIAQLPQQTGMLRARVLGDKTLLLGFHGLGTGEALLDDLVCAAADESFVLEPPIRDADRFVRCLAAGRAELVPAAERLITLAAEVLTLHRDIRRRLDALAGTAFAAAREDVAAQLRELVWPGFLTATPREWRVHVPRYLRAVGVRLEKLGHPKDGQHQAVVAAAWRRYDEWRATRPTDWPQPEAMARYRWMIEELRVSLFAQALGTALPVSAKRLEDAWRGALWS
jgi:ATP-dependent helicase HrpA